MKLLVARIDMNHCFDYQSTDVYALRDEVGDDLVNDVVKYSSRVWKEYSKDNITFYCDVEKKHLTFLKIKYPSLVEAK